VRSPAPESPELERPERNTAAPNVEPTDTPVPATPLPGLAERLDALRPGAAAQAWPALYRLWGYASTAPDEATACTQAAEAGLACLDGTGSWGLLRRFDRPAILTVQTASGAWIPVVLEGATGEWVRLRVAGQGLEAPREALEAIWLGAYRLLWKTPPSGREVLRPETRNGDIPWLRDRLVRANRPAPPAAEPDRYDARLVETIRALQRAHGLQPDGIAGANTLITLNNLLADDEIPRLVAPAAAPAG
jgi:general secretion pathway protein A